MRPIFTLAPIFSDHMVFQAGKPAILFGTCRKKAELKVDWRGESIRYRAEGTTFSITLPAASATTTPFAFTVSSRKQIVTVSDCLVGEVLLCAGEQNMRFTLRDVGFETRPSANRNIRFFDVPRLPYANAHLDYPAAYAYDPKWTDCHKESAFGFSAIGYYIAQMLSEELDVPVGVIACSENDTNVFSWAATDALASVKALDPHMAGYRDELAKYARPDDYDKLYKTIMAKDPERRNPDREELPMGPKHRNRPGGAFEAMLGQVAPFPVRAVVLYHGESGPAHADLYEEGFRALIRSWRTVFGEPSLPFIFTQIAGCGRTDVLEPGLALVREAQAACINPTDGVFMATAVDLGEESSSTPKDKREIARRLGCVLLEKVFHKGKNSGSPALFSYQYTDGRLIVYTQYNNLNLVSHSGQNLGFAVRFDNGREFEAENVELTGNQIVIRNIRKAKEVRYCFSGSPHCDIFAANDLPLLPFRIKLES